MKIIYNMKVTCFYQISDGIVCNVLVPAVTNDGQDVHEQVDDVKIEIEGSKDILLRTERVLVGATNHQLGIVDDVQTENDAANSSINQVPGPALLKEESNQSKQKETHEDSQQNT